MSARSAVMVGRDAELASLWSSFKRAESGETQIALVMGEAGIGKTRLVREFVARASGTAVVAFGHAVPLSGGALPYGVASDLLRSLVRAVPEKDVADVLGVRSRVLAPLVPQLGEGSEAPVDRPALYSATQDLLNHLAADRTLLLVLEDLHWAEESSLDLIQFWARTVVQGHLMLVVTSRSLGVQPTLVDGIVELRRLPNTEVVEVTPLDALAMEAQARSIDETVSEELVADVRRLGDGIPLYVEELMVAGRRDGASRALRVDLAASLGALPEGSAHVLRLMALESRAVDVALMAAVACEPASAVRDILDEGAAAGVVEATQSGRWRFRHELLRQAAAGSMSPSLRRREHERWATTLSGLATPSVADLIAAGDHWRAVGAPEEELEARVRAARASSGVANTPETRDQWRSLLVQLSSQPGLGSEALREEAVVGAVSGDLVWREALDVVKAQEESIEAAESVRGLWSRLVRFCASLSLEDVGSLALSPEAAARIRAELADAQPRPLVFHTVDLLVRACHALGLSAERDRCVELLADVADAVADELPATWARLIDWRLVVAGTQQSPLEARERVLRESAQLVERLPSSERGGVLMQMALTRLRRADLAGAMEHVSEALEVLHGPEAGGFYWYPLQAMWLGLLWRAGRWDEALELAPRVRPGGDRRESHNVSVAVEALIRAHRGDLEGCSDCVGNLVPVVWSRHDQTTGYLTRHFAPLIAAVALEGTDPPAARDRLRPVLSDVDEYEALMVSDFLLVASRLLWRTPPPDRSFALLVGESELRGLGNEEYDVVYRKMMTAHRLHAEGADTPETWAAAARAWAAMGVPLYQAESELRMGAALLRDNLRDEAAEALDSALTTAEGLEARPLADEIRTLASRSRLRLLGAAPAVREDTGPLTSREHEVLQLLVQGMTNEQIGTALFISPRTASVHVSRILAKLGATNRTQVAAVAHRRGLVQ